MGSIGNDSNKSEKVIDEFQQKHLDKFKEYIDIYEDFKKGGFEFEDDDQDESRHNHTDIPMQVVDHQQPSRYGNNILKNTLEETDMIFKLEVKNLEDLNKKNSLNYYSQFREAKYSEKSFLLWISKSWIYSGKLKVI